MSREDIIIVLLFLILIVLLYGRKAFWKGVVSAVAAGAILIHFGMVVACFGIPILLVEMLINIGTSDLPFEEWLRKHSVSTLWLPALAILVGYILYARREHQKILPTKPNN